jgi:hypothetical protein
MTPCILAGRSIRVILLMLAAALSASCSGSIGPEMAGPGEPPSPSGNGLPAPTPPGGGTTTPPGGGTTTPPTPAIPGDSACGVPAVVALEPRRLTRAEITNTLAEAFGVAIDPQTLPEDASVSGFSANRGQEMGTAEAEQLFDVMMVAAKGAAGKVTLDLGCALSDATCVGRFIDRWGRRLYRRALTTDEQTRVRAFVTNNVGRWGATEALPLVLAGMLTAPQFLHVIEQGRTVAGARTLTPEELATRWALTLFQAAPAPELIDTVSRGDTETAEGRKALLGTMVRNPSARRGFGQFHLEWLELVELNGDRGVAPWNETVATRAKEEVRTLAADAVVGGATFGDLMTTRQGLVDPAMAGLYGVTAPAGTQLTPVTLGPERAGLLSRLAFLVSFSDNTGTTIVRRGHAVRERVLCTTLPDPPPDADLSIKDRVGNAMCSGCHALMDPIGGGFQRYDIVGRYRADVMPSSPPEVRVAGDLVATDPAVGPFDDVSTLGAHFAQSPGARDCYTTMLLRYALRAGPQGWHTCAARNALRALPPTATIESMVVALLASDTYRSLPAIP